MHWKDVRQEISNMSFLPNSFFQYRLELGIFEGTTKDVNIVISGMSY